MKRLIEYALRQPLIIVLATLLFALAGVVAFKNLSVEAFPDVTDTQVTVISLFPGRAAEEVEKQVTLPIEVAMSGLPNAIRVFSHTQFGLSYTVVTYDDNAAVNLVRQQVAERLRGIDLPPGVEADIAPNATPVGEIMRYRVRGDGLTAADGVHALVGLALDAHAIAIDAERLRQPRAHRLDCILDFRALENHRHVEVADLVAVVPHHPRRFAQQDETVGVLPPRIRIGEMTPDVAESDGAEDGVGGRVADDVGVGVPQRPLVGRDRHAAKDQRAPLDEAVQVVARPGASRPRRLAGRRHARPRGVEIR